MSRRDKALQKIRESPRDVRFSNLVSICKHYFGEPTIHGSHHVFNTPWPGEPRVNLQPGKSGKAKPYQVRQALDAIDKLTEDDR